ncbi:DUF192 domain-containing protein [Salinigranum sp. GCM10025319]|uniref:DUF192 domain-containing protein n=1 Tax=Salinigranum sp. GCM10025319 TaxID=3252687 RepID=UPI00360D3E33
MAVDSRQLLAVAVLLVALTAGVLVAQSDVLAPPSPSTPGDTASPSSSTAADSTASSPSASADSASPSTTADATEDSEYDRTTVELVDDSSESLAEIDVRIADTREKRFLGLSATESLEPREGMLFVHDSEGRYAYVMRDMDFPLDIVFVAPDGTVTTIHHATLPPEGTSESQLTRYPGRGKYVLEMPMGTANETGLDEGDRVVIPDSVG